MMTIWPDFRSILYTHIVTILTKLTLGDSELAKLVGFGERCCSHPLGDFPAMCGSRGFSTQNARRRARAYARIRAHPPIPNPAAPRGQFARARNISHVLGCTHTRRQTAPSGCLIRHVSGRRAARSPAIHNPIHKC